MGYTHYWRYHGATSDAQLAETVEDCWRVIERSDVKLSGPSGYGVPIIDNRSMAFNGWGPEAHETMLVPGRIGFNFCKTGEKRYDVLVCACLIVMHHHLGVEVKSDGTDDDWKPARDLCEQALGYSRDFRL